MLRIVADLGNTRLKWGRLDGSGRIVEVIALPLDEPAAWSSAWEKWIRLEPGDSWWAAKAAKTES